MGDRENWTNGKVWKTELTENLCFPLSECRKVTGQKWFKHSHASMLKQNLGWVTGKTEPKEKFRKLNWQNFCLWISECGISVLAIMKKLKNGWHFFNINRIKKFPITDPPKFGSLVFQVSKEMEYQCQPLWKNWKMAAISLISIVWKNFQLLTPPKFGSLVFQVLMEMEYQCRPLWKNWKMAAISLISIIWKNFQLLTPHPKFGSPVFWVSMETEYQCQPLWKNWKMAAISLILIIWKNFQLLTPPQSLGLWFSKCQQKWNISRYWRCKFSFFWIFHWIIFPHHPS